MKLGVSAFAWTARFAERHLELLPKVRGWGFDGFEIPMFVPGDLPVAGLRKAFAETELECMVCAILPSGVNPISPDAAVRARALEHLIACVETTAEMGGRLMGGPVFAPIGYLPGHRPTTDEFAWAAEVFQGLVGHLESHDVTLSIEPVNRAETFFIRTAAEGKALCETVGSERVGVTIDTFHANIEEKSVVAALELLGPHLKHVHASENDRGLVGSGCVDFPGIVAALKKIGYGGYVAIEGFGYSADEIDGPGFLWADKGVSPEDVAVLGMEYLKVLI